MLTIITWGGLTVSPLINNFKYDIIGNLRSIPKFDKRRAYLFRSIYRLVVAVVHNRKRKVNGIEFYDIWNFN